ncbi:Phenylacetate-coenzyme A ligase PaaK, adenylate-forming domain family [Bosea sp. OK403]|uniref:LuxE/PaaK family acyltransferase n=1 Tax=Bosea sp. OK403 TaxID=1855286 RepID=UPI0008E476F9|nr:long-chain fatty acid--CoA ligase [Bosea sp. OK403]SFI00920.1 Phenylacetate-coenzyme A ligase PaaK, adenylate-forming domain family [Bosea sp. OK403]
MDVTEAQIIAALLEFFDREEVTDEDFDRLAQRIFAYQFENNQPYRRFAAARGRTPLSVRSWRDIPAVPIDAFKDLTLSCRPTEGIEHVFMTSGTTRGGQRGRSYHPTLAVYDRSMILNFRQRFMQGRNRMQGLDRIRMGILFPDEQAMPNSSLAHYLALARRECGTPDSEGFIDGAGLATARLLATLERAEAGEEPYALLGASYSFVHLLDELQRQGRRFALPPGSRILDTGGFKGQSRELAADEFYDALSAALGVPRDRCINMYGMTELSTQFYDWGNETCPPVKSGPHWIRSRVVNPLTGQDLPAGETGVLVHHDLAHFNSVSAILTEDAGVVVPGGFRLLGRVDGADSKGCSVAVEEFLKAARG